MGLLVVVKQSSCKKGSPRLFFFCSSLSLGHSIYSVQAGGATVPNLAIYTYYTLQYWCGGAALLAKLWVCGRNCAGFGKCAAWVGLTFGLNDLSFALFHAVHVGFLLMEDAICLMGRSFNFMDALICFVYASFNFMEARIYFVGVSFNFVEALIYFMEALICFVEAPI